MDHGRGHSDGQGVFPQISWTATDWGCSTKIVTAKIVISRYYETTCGEPKTLLLKLFSAALFHIC